MFEDTKDEIETITGRTDNTMVKKMIKRLTMIYKILQRRLKIKQQKTLKATWGIQVLPPCQYVQPRCNPDT